MFASNIKITQMKYNSRDKLFGVYEVKNGVVEYSDDAPIYNSHGIGSFLIRYNKYNDTKYYSIPQFNKNQSSLKIELIK